MCWDMRQWQIKEHKVRSQDLELDERVEICRHRGANQSQEKARKPEVKT